MEHTEHCKKRMKWGDGECECGAKDSESRSNDLLDADKRDAKYGWAPGNYQNTCHVCNQTFMGDKRAVMCADCAYGI